MVFRLIPSFAIAGILSSFVGPLDALLVFLLITSSWQACAGPWGGSWSDGWREWPVQDGLISQCSAQSPLPLRTLPWSFSWLMLSTPWTCYQGVGCVAAGNQWTFLGWFSVLWVTPLNGANSLPPLFHGGLVHFHWAVAGMSWMQRGVHSCIFVDYLTHWYQPLARWNHQCIYVCNSTRVDWDVNNQVESRFDWDGFI